MKLQSCALSVVLLLACSPAKVRLQQSPPIEPTSSTHSRRLADDFWTAAERLQTDRAIELAPTEAHRELARALEHVLGGDVTQAIARLEPLSRGAQDPRLADTARLLRVNLFAGASCWSDVARLQSGALPTAFASMPAEEVHGPAGEQVLSVTFNRAGTPLVEVEILGVKRRFLFDTGASLTVVSSDLAKACGLRAVKDQATSIATGNRRTVESRPTCVGQLTLGGIHIRNHPALILDSKRLTARFLGIPFLKIDGILGWNAIRRFRAVIDYERSTLTLSASESTAGGPRNFFWMGYPVVRTQALDGTPVYLGFDSGARRTRFHSRIVEHLNLAGGQKSTERSWGAGGFSTESALTLPEVVVTLGQARLMFQDRKATNHPIGVFAKLDGVLGNDVRLRRLTLDYPKGRFELE